MNDFPSIEMERERPCDRIREFYLYQEPFVLAAMRQGDRGEAVRLINHILVHIYAAGQERGDLLKGLLLELVVMSSRAAVEAGASQNEVLGINFQCLTELAQIDDDEQIALWLRDFFERMFTAMESRTDFTSPLLVTKALDYIRQNLHRDITRDETAWHVGISPSHFSRLLRERTARSFTELLRQCRLEHACKLLQETERTLSDIADACGFCDQSYFTRVFQQAKQSTPGQYRAAHKSTRHETRRLMPTALR